MLSGLRAFLWISGEAKSRDFDQVWFAARALLRGGKPYQEIGPGLQFDWPAPLYYPLTAAIAVMPLSSVGRRLAAVIFAAIASGAFVWAATPPVARAGCSDHQRLRRVAAETVQWSPLLGAAYGIPWLGALLSAKPTIGFAIFAARPTRAALDRARGHCSLLSLALMPSWPREWISALHHTSLATDGGTPYFAPVGHGGGALSALALLRWRRPEARLVLALACVPQTPLLYETVPLFLVPATITEGGVLWLGSWVAALWLSGLGPYGE